MSMADDLFHGSANKAEKLESFAKAMDTAVERKGPRKQFVMKGDATQNRVVGSVGVDPRQAELKAAAEQLASIQKGLDPDVAAAMQSSIDAMTKDLTLGNATTGPVPGNLAPYDLEAPAKILVPRFTPLRNEIPRVAGQGTNREFRRILGYSNAQVGGVPDMGIFLDSEFSASPTSGGTAFGPVTLRRGPKIQYNMDIQHAQYVEMSVSDSVTYKAQFGNLGFENTRSLSAMALLWAHMIGEEKALLFGRGLASQGYAGPAGLTAAASSSYTATATTSGGTLATGSYTVQYSVRQGVGEGPASTAVTAVSVTGPTGGINIGTQPAIPAGALGLNWYVTLSGQSYFVGLQTSTASAFQIKSLGAAVAALPSADTSAGPSGAQSGGYDGLLTVLTGPNSGYYNNSGYTVKTSGDAFLQDAFAGLFNKVFADPDEVWLNAAQSRALGDYFRSGPSASSTSGAGAFRISFEQNGLGQVGTIVETVYNQSSPTRKAVDLRVHPYMPAGSAIVRSRTLDIPDSGVGDTSQVVAVQEYMGIDWPEIQFTYDASTYWFGTFVHYAPAWSGAIQGLA